MNTLTVEFPQPMFFDAFGIGQFATIKGNIFYFHGQNTKHEILEPIYKLLENGTLVEFMDPFQSVFKSNPEFFVVFKITHFLERTYQTHEIKTHV